MTYLDLFSNPLDSNTFDNLPPSQAVPNTFTMKPPKKLQYHSFAYSDSDQMLTSNFKLFFTKLDKLIKSLTNHNTILIIDNLNIMINSCNYANETLEFIEIMNEILSMPDRYQGLSVALLINRDLLTLDDEILDSMTLDFYREQKKSVFDTVFEVNRNLSGYTRDVHGQLNVIRNKNDAFALSDPNVKNVKFRLTENKVELFEHFVI